MLNCINIKICIITYFANIIVIKWLWHDIILVENVLAIFMGVFKIKRKKLSEETFLGGRGFESNNPPPPFHVPKKSSFLCPPMDLLNLDNDNLLYKPET